MKNIKERPIIMSGDMVNAILDGKKTMTRRPIKHDWMRHWTAVKKHPGGGWMATDGTLESLKPIDDEGFKCRYGKVGDRLWVREILIESSVGSNDVHKVGYLASFPDGIEKEKPDLRFYQDAAVYRNSKLVDWFDISKPQFERNWIAGISGRGYGKIPSNCMPRWASRINLEIIDVRAERLWEISEEDCDKEGCPWKADSDLKHILWYEILWNSINKKSEFKWDANPYVWVIEFNRIT